MVLVPLSLVLVPLSLVLCTKSLRERGWAVRNGAKTCGAGAGVRRHPGEVDVLNTSGTVTAFFLAEHPLGRDSFNFFPTQDKGGFGQT
ncbi:hypothetical protein TPA0906_01580 [Streptomyces olivaceus]|nr:hypothetical protein TPA0906_01580 [Streptomyces olivaceus]